MDVEYLSGEEVAKVVEKTVNAPPRVVERFKAALELN